MIRNLKSFALALVAVLATCAVAVSAASAAELHSEAEDTTLTGTQGTTHTFTFKAGSLKCSVAKFAGTVTGKTTTATEISSTFEKCTMSGVATSVDMMGCRTKTTWWGFGDTHLVCPITGEVVDEITNSTASCSIKVAPQTMKTSKFVNLGTGTTREVEVIQEITGTKYTQTGECLGGKGTFSDGTYTGTTVFTGENSKGEHVGIWGE